MLAGDAHRSDNPMSLSMAERHSRSGWPSSHESSLRSSTEGFKPSWAHNFWHSVPCERSALDADLLIDLKTHLTYLRLLLDEHLAADTSAFGLVEAGHELASPGTCTAAAVTQIRI
jgi:hypothetical protein